MGRDAYKTQEKYAGEMTRTLIDSIATHSHAVPVPRPLNVSGRRLWINVSSSRRERMASTTRPHGVHSKDNSKSNNTVYLGISQLI